MFCHCQNIGDFLGGIGSNRTLPHFNTVISKTIGYLSIKRLRNVRGEVA